MRPTDGANGIGHGGMLGQNDIAQQRLAHCRVIGGRRSPKPDHSHIQTGFDLHQSRRAPQSAPQQLMAGQFRRRAAIGVDLLRKGRREQGLRGLSGELINDDFRHLLGRPRQRLAGSRAPAPPSKPDQSQPPHGPKRLMALRHGWHRRG